MNAPDSGLRSVSSLQASGSSATQRSYQGPVQSGQYYQSGSSTAAVEELDFTPDWCDSFQDEDIESVQQTRRRHDELADSTEGARKEGLRRHRRHLSVVEPDRYAYDGSSAPPPEPLGSNLVNTAMFILERLASDPYTPPTFLKQLADHPDADLRAVVAENKNTPLEVVVMLAKDSDVNVRYQLAENHNLSMIVLQSLVHDDNPYVACRAQQTLSRLS